MTLHRTALTVLAVAAALGTGACGVSSDTADRVQEKSQQIREDAAQLREDAKQITEDAKAGKDTTAAEEALRKSADETIDKTKGVADDVLQDVGKNVLVDGASRKAIEDAREQLQPTP